jgi:ABC-type nitrate/sulfonate/bicarbonate transport system substrate-binding protein
VREGVGFTGSGTRLAVLAAILAIGVAGVGAGCGGSDDSGGGSGEKGSMRFVFAPDPAWRWIEDQGILDQMEEESGYNIQRFETEDEFAAFAGGHADIVSTGSYETPVLEKETGVETATIGKYNRAQDIIVVKHGSGYKTLGDLPEGCKVGVESFEGSSLVWQALGKDLDNRELAQGSDDLEMAITDFEVSPELVVKGDLCAGVTAMTTAIPYLMDGSVDVLYNGQTASQLYEKYYEPGHIGMDSNNFVTLKSWYEDHPGEVAFFLSVWQRAMDEFAQHRDEIIAKYPEDFGWTNDDELKFVQDYFKNTYNNFLDSVYLTPDWIKGESGVTDILRDAGLVPEDQPDPFMVCIDPKTGKQTCAFPQGSS